jgi:hypothetical protein
MPQCDMVPGEQLTWLGYARWLMDKTGYEGLEIWVEVCRKYTYFNKCFIDRPAVMTGRDY